MLNEQLSLTTTEEDQDTEKDQGDEHISLVQIDGEQCHRRSRPSNQRSSRREGAEPESVPDARLCCESSDDTRENRRDEGVPQDCVPCLRRRMNCGSAVMALFRPKFCLHHRHPENLAR